MTGPGPDQRTIARSLLGLAWPLIVYMMLFFVDSANVRYWMGRYLGAEGMAVHTTTAMVVGLMFLLFLGVVTGAGVVLARSVGARDGRALSLLGSAVVLTIVMWVVVVAVVLVVADPVAAYLAKTSVAPESIRTFIVWWCVLAMPAFTFVQLCVSAANAAGLTRFALSQGIVHILITLGLLPLMLGPLELGYRAPAIAVCVASLVNVAQLGVRLSRHAKERHLGDRVDRALLFDLRVWRDIVDIGLPAQLSRATSWIVLIAVVLRVRESGVPTLAGYGIAMALVDIVGGASGGFSIAAQIMMAQRLGARDPATARRVLKTSLAMVCLIPALAIAILIPLASPIVDYLAANAAVHEEGVRALRLMVLVLIPAAFWQLLLQAFAAARATKRVLLVTLVAQAIAFAITSAWTGDTIWGALITIAVMHTLCVGFYLLLSIPVLWRGALADQPS